MPQPRLKPVEGHLAGVRFSTRMLASPGRPALEFMEACPDGPAKGAPLLFLHGAFGGAWTWREIFMPLFARRGRRMAAVSLRGHGGSEGHAELRLARLDDYLADVRLALAQFDEPPIVVAHSLGGLLAQMLLGQERMRGLALIASLPPEGMAFESVRLSLTDPQIWFAAFLGSVEDAREPVALAVYRVLFSDGLPPERIRHYASLMTPEAPLAMAEAHMPRPILSAGLCGVPALVLGGTEDRLVWHASALRTALYHAARHHRLDGVGHFMMLDPGAEEVARVLFDWLEERAL